jgi:hypothetical protein
MGNCLPTAFLFDAMHDGNYGARFDKIFLRTLKAMDAASLTKSLLMRGDLLIANMAYKPAKVSIAPPVKSKRKELQSQPTRIQMRGDKGLYATLVGDLCDAFSKQVHTLDLVSCHELIANHNIHCMFLPTLREELIIPMDGKLRTDPYYKRYASALATLDIVIAIRNDVAHGKIKGRLTLLDARQYVVLVHRLILKADEYLEHQPAPGAAAGTP